MKRLQKPADQYDESTMHLALQVLEGCISCDYGLLPISFLYEVLSHDTDDKLMLRKFEEHHKLTLLEHALISYNPNDHAYLKDKGADIVAAVLATNGTKDISLAEPHMGLVTALLDFLKTNPFFVPSCSIIIENIRDIKVVIEDHDLFSGQSQDEKIKQQVDQIKDFTKTINFTQFLSFPPSPLCTPYTHRPECYEQIIDATNKKINEMKEGNIKNGQWLSSYFNDIGFNDASGNNMGDPGLIICEYLGASAQRIMETNKSGFLSLNPSFTDSKSDCNSAACASLDEVSCAGESENASMDG